MMTLRRLVEKYAIGARVRVQFGDRWLPGTVVAHAHPAVWVELDDGRRFFVTNSRRIRSNVESSQ